MPSTPARVKSEWWPIDRLKLWDRNPREIKPERLEELKVRLQRQGQIKPLLVTGDGTVIGGNMRLRAMRELGIADVWVSITAAKTDREIFDLAVTDNEEFGYYEQEQVAELALDLGLSPLELQAYHLQLSPARPLDELLLQFMGEPDIELPDGDKDGFEQMTFTLTGAQAATVREAMDRAKVSGFDDTGNDNSNGNAIALIVEAYLSGR